MKPKNILILCDFDGTLTQIDVLDFLADAYGKREEKELLKQEIQKGLHQDSILEKRIDLLKGMSLEQIQYHLASKEILRVGWEELKKTISEFNIHFVLLSGNISPVIEYYQELLGASCQFSTSVILKNGNQIDSIGTIHKRKDIVCSLFTKEQLQSAIIIGDDTFDIPFFELSTKSIAFNAKTAYVKEMAKYKLNGNLSDLVKLLKKILKF